MGWQNEGSFGFAKRWLLCRAKTNVPECAVGFLFLCLYAAKIPLSFCRLFCLFTMNANARLYAVGRGFSARYESFRPNAVNRGERNPQYALEPRLPYTALLCPVFYFLVFMKLTISSVNPAFKGNSGFRYVAIFFCISESDSFNT